jgi:hypothetical protein
MLAALVIWHIEEQGMGEISRYREGVKRGHIT